MENINPFVHEVNLWPCHAVLKDHKVLNGYHGPEQHLFIYEIKSLFVIEQFELSYTQF